MLVKFCQHLVYKFLMLTDMVFFGFSQLSHGVDSHVVHIYCHASVCNEVAKYCVYYCLEHC